MIILQQQLYTLFRKAKTRLCHWTCNVFSHGWCQTTRSICYIVKFGHVWLQGNIIIIIRYNCNLIFKGRIQTSVRRSVPCWWGCSIMNQQHVPRQSTATHFRSKYSTHPFPPRIPLFSFLQTTDIALAVE